MRLNWHFLNACPPNHTFKTVKEKWDLQITIVYLYPLWCFFFPCFPVQPCWRDTCESPHLFLLGTRTYTGEIVSQSDVHSCTLWLLVSYPTLLKMVFRFTPTCRNDMIIQHAAGKKLRHLNTLLELCLIMKCRITLHYNLCVAHPPTKVTQ